MEYGQSITPRTFFTTVPQFFTKQAFASYMARALQTVGMIPLPINSYDLADPASETRTAVSENTHFWFDYPTEEYFVPGGASDPTRYRPVLGLTHSVYAGFSGNGDQTSPGTQVGYFAGANVGFLHCRRRADRVLLSDMKTHHMLRVPADVTHATNYGQLNYDVYYGYVDGHSVWGTRYWKLSASWADANMQTLLFVNRVFVHLGKAGLIIQVGTHPTRRAETANIYNVAALFGGGRIPGRERPPQVDTLRDTLDPVFYMDLVNTRANDANGVAYTQAGIQYMASAALGGARTFDGAFQQYAQSSIITRMRSIDYVDGAALDNAPTDVYVRPSPTVVNGNNVHALHRACYYTYLRANTSDRIGRIDSGIQPNFNPLVAWEDAYYIPGFALGDRVMSVGKKLDPNTGKNWYSLWSESRSQAFAIDYDGVLELTTLSNPTMTQDEYIPIDLSAEGLITPPYNSNPTRTPSLRNGSTLAALPGTFGTTGITAKVGVFEFCTAPSTPRWQKANGTNIWSLTSWGWPSWDGTKYMQLLLDLQGLVLSTDQTHRYILEYDYYCTVNNNTAGDPANSNNYFELQTEVGLGNLSDSSAQQSTRYSSARAGSPGYVNVYSNYASYGSLANPFPVGATTVYREVREFQADAQGRAYIVFGLQHNYNNQTTQLTAGIRDITLRRYLLG